VETTFRPISKRRLSQLRGYVAPGIAFFRAVLFLAVVGAVGALFRAIHNSVASPRLFLGAIWVVPTLAFAVVLYVRAGR
jgi:hypothetical protein